MEDVHSRNLLTHRRDPKMMKRNKNEINFFLLYVKHLNIDFYFKEKTIKSDFRRRFAS